MLASSKDDAWAAPSDRASFNMASASFFARAIMPFAATPGGEGLSFKPPICHHPGRGISVKLEPPNRLKACAGIVLCKGFIPP